MISLSRPGLVVFFISGLSWNCGGVVEYADDRPRPRRPSTSDEGDGDVDLGRDPPLSAAGGSGNGSGAGSGAGGADGNDGSGAIGGEHMGGLAGGAGYESKPFSAWGATFAWTDMEANGTSTIEQVITSGGFCGKGVTAQVLDQDFGRYYGSAVGIYLSGTASDDGPVPVDVSEFTGVYFRLTGDGPFEEIRLEATQVNPETNSHDTYCATEQLSEGVNYIPFSSLTYHCWDTKGDAIDPRLIDSLQWHVVTHTTSSVEFSFCVQELGLVSTQ